MQGRRPIQASSGRAPPTWQTSVIQARCAFKSDHVQLVLVPFRGWLSEDFPSACNNFLTHILNRLNLLSHCAQ
jgi:hypothetical protein